MPSFRSISITALVVLAGATTAACAAQADTTLSVNVNADRFPPAAHAHVFRYSGANPTAIVPAPGFTATFPARSATLIVIPAR